MKKTFRKILFKIPFFRRAGQRALMYLRAYAAAKSNRFTADWSVEYGTINKEIKSAFKSVRARARDLWKNNDLVRAYRRKLRANVVGPDGFTLQMRIKDTDGTNDSFANNEIERHWKRWSRTEFCTMQRTMSLTRVLWWITEGWKRDGEVLIRKVVGKNVNEYGFALELIEPDLLDEEENRELPNGNVIVMGIELDQWRKPVAYYFKDNSTRNELSGIYTTYITQGGKRLNRIPADEIIHIFDPEHSNQFRGISHLAQSMLTFHNLAGYDEAAVIAARVGASATMVIEKENDSNTPYEGDTEDSEGNRIQNLSFGEVPYLEPGEKVASWAPNYPHDQYPHFVKAIQRRIAVGLGMSYNSWLSDLEGVNFSSMRSGLLEERDQWLIDQAFIIDVFLKPVFEEWLKMALTVGIIKLPIGKFEKFNQPEFIGRRWAWVDPLKDVQASIQSIENGLSTQTRELKKQGIDFDDWLQERKQELEKIKAAGIGMGVPATPAVAIEPDEDDNKAKAFVNGNGKLHNLIRI